MFDSEALSSNDFSSLSISSKMESDAETKSLFSAREKLDMSRRRHAAKLDMIAITSVETTNRLVVLRAPAMARQPDAIKKTELQIPAARGMFAPYMIPIVFAANAVSPQIMCTIPSIAATFLMAMQ